MKRNDFDVRLGKLLKEAREEKGYSQQYVADRMGVTRQSIYYWERGERGIIAGYLLDFCDVVGADVSEISKELKKKHE